VTKGGGGGRKKLAGGGSKKPNRPKKLREKSGGQKKKNFQHKGPKKGGGRGSCGRGQEGSFETGANKGPGAPNKLHTQKKWGKGYGHPESHQHRPRVPTRREKPQKTVGRHCPGQESTIPNRKKGRNVTQTGPETENLRSPHVTRKRGGGAPWGLCQTKWNLCRG